MSEFLERVRRASKKTPRQLAARLVEMGSAQLQQPWARVYPHVLTERALLKAAAAPSIDALWERQLQAPFFVAPERRDALSRTFRARYPDAPDAIVAGADRILRHEFDLLGSGCVTLARELPWHTDFKSGRQWPIEYAAHLEFLEINRPTDVKVPWELSRCQHFTTLGQAYWLTGDEKYAREFVDEASDWIARNPWAYGVNWVCAMDVALRAVSWIWGFYFLGAADACRSAAFRASFLRALFMHGAFIAGHLERGDVNGNHYLCDAVGLVFLGTFFRATSQGRSWLQTGKDIVDTEIFKQTSDDGVDFEKSTSYHRLVLEAFLTSHLLLEGHGDRLSPRWLARLERMIEFVEAYTKPDGTVPLIGDADDGRVQKLGLQGINDHRYLLAVGAVLFNRGDFKRGSDGFGDEAFWLLGAEAAEAFDAIDAPAAPLESKAFHEGGFYVLRTDRAHVIVDCGEVGMHGRGGHGHSDITSLEIWLAGMNLVSDCGAYLYTASRDWRNRFRSTAFHNVLQVDGEELNRLISPDHLWQLRDDARPLDVAWRWGEGADYFRGSHNGYARLDPPVRVTRKVLLVKDGPDVLVRDSADGSGSHQLVWRFHLDPAVSAAIDHDDVHLRVADREAWLQIVDPLPGSRITVEDGWISPSYGVRMKTEVVVISVRASLPVHATYRIGLARITAPPLRSLAAVLSAAQSG
jgi:hypothetical protein